MTMDMVTATEKKQRMTAMDTPMRKKSMAMGTSTAKKDMGMSMERRVTVMVIMNTNMAGRVISTSTDLRDTNMNMTTNIA